MGQEVIELTEEQKQFIQEKFVGGRRLLDRIESFRNGKLGVELCIATKEGDGIAVGFSYYKDLCWICAFPKRVFVEFKKEEVENE